MWNNDINQTSDFPSVGQRKLDTGTGGIIDYRARMFSPYINRFLQPDSLIPNPANPQSWNRFAYVLNNPVILNDPTGHTSCSSVSYGNGAISEDECDYTDQLFGITFTGDWTEENQEVVRTAVRDIDSALAQAGENCAYIAGIGTECESASVGQSFRAVYDTGINFEWVSRACEINGYTCYGYAGHFPNTIQIYEKYWAEGVNQQGATFQFQAATPVTAQLIVHELGHAFNVLANGTPETFVSRYNGGSLTRNRHGFVPGFSFGQDNSASEIFADMFVGWVYNKWLYDDVGPTRASVMTTNIGAWVAETQSGR